VKCLGGGCDGSWRSRDVGRFPRQRECLCRNIYGEGGGRMEGRAVYMVMSFCIWVRRCSYVVAFLLGSVIVEGLGGFVWLAGYRAVGILLGRRVSPVPFNEPSCWVRTTRAVTFCRLATGYD